MGYSDNPEHLHLKCLTLITSTKSSFSSNVEYSDSWWLAHGPVWEPFFSYHIYFIIQCWRFSLSGVILSVFHLNPSFSSCNSSKILIKCLKTSITCFLEQLCCNSQFIFSEVTWSSWYSPSLTSQILKSWVMYDFIILLVKFYVLERFCMRNLDSVSCKVAG